ncbi:hypothetical protein [Sebaldella sp. S0638]|uniref:hypothetical protein n=1 Tax=Sebaldella sp. S0638 TaxID=2957809 RepID=UPI00209E01C6|nr:hypothetical protein [Sebaldella sp. S0638]
MYSNRTKTSQDAERSSLNNYLGTTTARRGTTGWITDTEAWNTNMGKYDNTAVLTVIPVIKIPQVITPQDIGIDLPEVEEPEIPEAPEILLMPVHVDPISVNVEAPVITSNVPVLSMSSPASLNLGTVSVNVNVDVKDITGPQFTDLAAPTLELTPPTLNVAPVTPPSIKGVAPDITTPASPPAPSFTAFNRGRGDWLGGFSSVAGLVPTAINTFNRDIKAWEQGAPPRVIDINNQAFFKVNGVIRGNGKDSNSVVQATTSSTGVVTNRYDNIQIVNGVTGGTPNNQYGSSPWPTVEVSPAGFPAIAAGTWVSYADEDSLTGRTYNTTRYQQAWIFQGSPTVEDMKIKVGGSSSYSTAVFAQTSSITMNRVSLELAGRSIVGQMDIRSAYKVSLTDVDINLTGDSNTIFSTFSISNQDGGNPGISDWRTRNDIGAAFTDVGVNANYLELGGMNLNASTSSNALFYIAPTSKYRWDGNNYGYAAPGMSSPVAYYTNPRKYNVFAPIIGNVGLDNASGNIDYIGSGNVGVWTNAYIADRTKWETTAGNSSTPYLNAGTLNLQGDQNVGYYFTKHTSRPDYNGIFQGNVDVDIKIGTDLDGKGGSTQTGTGNKSGNNAAKSEDNVGMYVDSGQRTGLNNTVGSSSYLEYFPATLDFKVDTATYSEIIGITNGTQIGFPYLSADPIRNLALSNFNVEFGKYSKNGIGIVAKNGSVVEIDTGSTISDNAGTGTNRAEGSVMFYTEGVWYNPRLAMTTSTYDSEAYGRGESQTGRKNIIDFNSTINVADDVNMGSNKATAFFAKNGGQINAQNVTLSGSNSIGAFAFGVNDLTSTVKSDNTGAGSQAATTVNVKSITATQTGTIDSLTDNSNSNIGAAAITLSDDGTVKGTGTTKITVDGNVTVNGIGAYGVSMKKWTQKS